MATEVSQTPTSFRDTPAAFDGAITASSWLVRRGRRRNSDLLDSDQKFSIVVALEFSANHIFVL